MVSSSVLPHGERTNVHIYVLTPYDYIDMGANQRALLHNRTPRCQLCTRELTDNDVSNGRVLCELPGCTNPDAILLWEGTSDGENPADDETDEWRPNQNMTINGLYNASLGTTKHGHQWAL